MCVYVSISCDEYRSNRKMVHLYDICLSFLPSYLQYLAKNRLNIYIIHQTFNKIYFDYFWGFFWKHVTFRRKACPTNGLKYRL